jgi:hypothetical protein
MYCREVTDNHDLFLADPDSTSSSNRVEKEGYKVISPFFKKMPKLLELSTPTYRNQKTLIWLQHQDPSIAWSRWSGIVASVADYHRWYDADARLVGMVLLTVEGEVDAFLEEVYTIAKDIPMILLPRTILSLKSEDFWADNFDNLLCLDDVLDSYPFLITSWNQTVEDAIAIFAVLFRYSRLVDVVEQRFIHFSPHIKSVQCITPPQSWLFTQYFVHPDKKRAKEIRECLVKNCACAEIDRIVLLNETDLSKEWKSIPGSEKIQQVVIGKRLTYAAFLNYVSNHVPANVYTILANADIYMDSSLSNLWKIEMSNRMLCLLRWDVPSDGSEPTLFGPRADSQDSWILLSDCLHGKTWDSSIFGFTLGQLGCDNAFAGHMLCSRFLLSNPALSIQTYHLHQSGIRNYSVKDVIRSDLYIHISPTHLLDTTQEQVPLGSPQSICNELVSFDIRSSSLSNEITYCTMLEKDGRYKWEPSVENHYFEPAIPIYSWKNAIVTLNGLVYQPYTVYTGKYNKEPRFQYWNGANADILTPLQERTRMVAVPFPDATVFFHPDTYVLHYLSRAMRIIKEYPNTSCWAPTGFEAYLRSLHGLPSFVEWKEDTGCWASEVVGFLPGPTSSELGREDIDGLRTLLPQWKSTPTSRHCVVLTDSTLSPSMVYEQLTPWLKSHGDWKVSIVSDTSPGVYDTLIGASLCILLGGPNTQAKWAKTWVLPRNCCVIEFQQELTVDGEFQHLCHIADWKSWIILLAKGSVSDVRAQILEQLEKWYKKHSSEM